MFKLSPEAADFNARILFNHHFNLRQILKNQHLSQISFGSEFRPLELLEKSLLHHPLWDSLKSILQDGALSPLQELSDSERAADLEFHKTHGNHK
jgi:hypothetical protein